MTAQNKAELAQVELAEFAALDDAIAASTLPALQRIKLTNEIRQIKTDMVAATAMQKIKLTSRLREIKVLLLGAQATAPVVTAEPTQTAEGEANAVQEEDSEVPEPSQQAKLSLGKRQKLNDAAIEALRKVQSGQASKDDPAIREALKGYSGSGGGLKTAQGTKSSPFEYYTPKPVAAAAWGLLLGSGFSGGKVMDPSAGMGIFAQTKPDNAMVDQIELDEYSGQINGILNDSPTVATKVSSFEAVAGVSDDETYDALITNVPFGTHAMRGAEWRKDKRYQQASLQNYFILRGLEKVRPGGLAGFIVPPSVVSGKSPKNFGLRMAMSAKAEFVGAYRLPNMVFDEAGADTITDVIVLRKHGKTQAQKIEEISNKNAALLGEANVYWQEFTDGDYFKGAGKKYVLGEVVTAMGKFGEVEKVASTGTIESVSKLMRPFGNATRIKWDMLNSVPTDPIVYSEGDTSYFNGASMELKEGKWVPVEGGLSSNDDSASDLYAKFTTPLDAIKASMTFYDAVKAYENEMNQGRGGELTVWFRAAVRDAKAFDKDPLGFFDAVLAGMAVKEFSDDAGTDATNFKDSQAELSRVLARVQAFSKSRSPSGNELVTKSLQAISIARMRGAFTPWWKGEIEKTKEVTRTLNQQYDFVKAEFADEMGFVPVEQMRKTLPDFDPMADDGWCISPDGQSVMIADDFYQGNFGDFVRNAREDADACEDPAIKEKLLRQIEVGKTRLDLIDVNKMTFTMDNRFVPLDEKAKFVAQYIHPDLVLVVSGKGEMEFKYTGADLKKYASEDAVLERKIMVRMAHYLNHGTITTGTKGTGSEFDPAEEQVLLQKIGDRINSVKAQYDAWCRSNEEVISTVKAKLNAPENLSFRPIPNFTPVDIENWNTDRNPHGYQYGSIRRYGKNFSGICALDVGLGKTLTALAAAQYCHSIGTKKKTVFVVPNSVLTNWRKEVMMSYTDTTDCLFVGLRPTKTGKLKYSASAVDEDIAVIRLNKHRKIFMTMENFKRIPLREETMALYQEYLIANDDSFLKAAKDGIERKTGDILSSQSAAAKVLESGKKSGAVPYFEDLGIDSIILDEAHCFPAGTLVDGRPIEQISVGDFVRSLNHETGKVEMKRVSDVMNRVPTGLVRVVLADGKSIVCTHDHQFFVPGVGYVAAEFLNSSYKVVSNDVRTQKDANEVRLLRDGISSQSESNSSNSEWRYSGDMLPPMSGYAQVNDCKIIGTEPGSVQVPSLPEGNHAEPYTALEVCERDSRQVLLREGMPHKVDLGSGCHQGINEVRINAGEEKGCIGEARLASHTGCDKEKHRIEAEKRVIGEIKAKSTGREWKAAIGSASDANGRIELGARVCDSDENAEGLGVPSVLQGGFGDAIATDRNRSGWEFSSIGGGEGKGQEEDGFLGLIGVDRIEVLESRGDRRFGGVCPTGLVYDITVEDNHNFFAEGILVHNCFKNSKSFSNDFGAAKYIPNPASSDRGMDMQAKCWYIRDQSPLGDGVIGLTATPITNSPLEIYSMLSLTMGEREFNNLCGCTGADSFMANTCDIDESSPEEDLVGRPKAARALAGISNLNILQRVLDHACVIETAETVAAKGIIIKVPESAQTTVGVELSPAETSKLMAIKAEYLDARDTPADGRDEETAIKASAFNLIRRMTKVITDPELSEGRFVFNFDPKDLDAANKIVADFSKTKLVDYLREYEVPAAFDVAKLKSVKKKDAETGVETVLYEVPVRLAIEGNALVLYSGGFEAQDKLMALVKKNPIGLSVKGSAKTLAMLANFKIEQGNPRWKPVKQIIFCDELAMHHKLRVLLNQECGIPLGKIAIVNAQAVDPEALQEIQDGFNASDSVEDEENKYSTIIANKKAEVGINLQKGTQAIHHLTIGWTPDSIHQRNGRGVRQGNSVEGPVNIYFYDANGTFDSYRRRLVSVKGDWIESVMDRSATSARVEGDISQREYDEMADAFGDSEKMAKLQESAAKKAKEAMSRTVKVSQVNALSVMDSRQKWLKRYGADAGRNHEGFANWVNGIASQIVTSQEQLEKAEKSLNFTESPAARAKYSTQVKSITERLASLKLRIEGVKRYANENLNVFSDGLETSVAYQNYTKEVEVNTKMVAEAEAAFLIRANDGGYSKDSLEAYKEGKAEIYAGNIIKAGDFAITESGQGIFISDKNSKLRLYSWTKTNGYEVQSLAVLKVHSIKGDVNYGDILKALVDRDEQTLADGGDTTSIYARYSTEVRDAMRTNIPSLPIWLGSGYNSVCITMPPGVFPIALSMRVAEDMPSLAKGQERYIGEAGNNYTGDYIVFKSDKDRGEVIDKDDAFRRVIAWLEANGKKIHAGDTRNFGLSGQFSDHFSNLIREAKGDLIANSKGIREFEANFVNLFANAVPWLDTTGFDTADSLAELMGVYGWFNKARIEADDGSEPYDHVVSVNLYGAHFSACWGLVTQSGFIPTGVAKEQFDVVASMPTYSRGMVLDDNPEFCAALINEYAKTLDGVVVDGVVRITSLDNQYAAQFRAKNNLGAGAVLVLEKPLYQLRSESYTFSSVIDGIKAAEARQKAEASGINPDKIVAALESHHPQVERVELGANPLIVPRDRYHGAVTLPAGMYVKVYLKYKCDMALKVANGRDGLPFRYGDKFNGKYAWVLSLAPVNYSDGNVFPTVEDFANFVGIDLKAEQA